MFLSPNPVLLLVPDSGHWVASTSPTGAKVDLCRDIAVGLGGVGFVDVEIDVVWSWGSHAHIDDLDELHALGLPAAEEASYVAEAERIRAAVDAGASPFGPLFRQRLLDLVPTADPRLAATWAGPVSAHLVDEVATLIGPEWIDRQRAGDGWLLCGGGGREVTAVVWIDADATTRLLASAPTPEGTAMGAYLVETAPALTTYPPPPLPSEEHDPAALWEGTRG